MKIKLNYKKSIIFLILLSVVAIFVWSQVLANLDRPLEIYFFDVGQGDATYIRTPGNNDIIIDGGPDNKVLEKLGKYMPFYDKKIELMVLTHPHEDHVAGLVDILKRYEVEYVLYSGIEYDTAVYEIWNDLVEQNIETILIAQNGQDFIMGDVMIDVVFPIESMNRGVIDNVNNSSVVTKIIYGNVSAMVMGDAEKEVEQDLIKSRAEMIRGIDLLKAGHHGSKTSSTPKFIELVDPQFAIISAGLNNRYHHPHKNTLDTFDKLDVELFRTDINGDIKCVTRGVEFTCEGI